MKPILSKNVFDQCTKYVDRYDITDTGSDDGTQDLIKKTMDELGQVKFISLIGRVLVSQEPKHFVIVTNKSRLRLDD